MIQEFFSRPWGFDKEQQKQTSKNSCLMRTYIIMWEKNILGTSFIDTIICIGNTFLDISFRVESIL